MPPIGCLTPALLLVSMVMWTTLHAATAEEGQYSYRLPGLVDDITGDDVIVSTDSGDVRGKRRLGDSRAEGATVTVDWFLGIPYAKPPVGELRFKKPESRHSWSPEVRNAFRFGHACPQIDRSYLWYANREFQNEDCLYLNVYSPFERVSEGISYPVMVFVHGGSYKVGSGSVYTGNLLAQHGVVVVTINYRLGILGFLASKDASLRGNYGLLDQIKALQWVQANIRSFRGDPQRVTIFGNSAGGSSVGLLSISPLAKGLFTQAIVQSGSPLAFWAVHSETADLTLYLRSVAAELSCDKTHIPDLVSCLSAVDWRRFVWGDNIVPQVERHLPRISIMGIDCSPVIDGYVITDSPQKLMETGSTLVPSAVMTGIVEDEWSQLYGLFLEDLPNAESYYSSIEFGLTREKLETLLRHVVCDRLGYDEYIYEIVRLEYMPWQRQDDKFLNNDQYLKFGADLVFVAPTVLLADELQKREVPVYLYVFNHRDKSVTGKYNYHSLELEYLFGSPFTGVSIDERELDIFRDGDREVSRMMMRLWTNFAKTGNPSYNSGVGKNHDVISWDAYGSGYSYLEFTNGSAYQNRHLRARKMDFWNHVIPSTLERFHHRGVGKSETATYSSVPTWIILGIGCLQLILVIALLVLALKRRRREQQRKP